MIVGVNIFEFLWGSDLWDIEIFKAQVGFGIAKENYTGSKHFTLRASPRIKILKYLSVGPVVGYEFISFPDVSVRLNEGNLFTPFEPFSSRGMIYGVSFAETIQVEANYQFTLQQTIYRQTYSTTKSNDGWTYFYERDEIQDDPLHALIEPSIVFLLGASLTF